MDFGLGEEQIALQDSLNRYLDEASGVDQVRAMAESNDGGSLWRGLVDLGVPGVLIPEARGGMGMTCLDAALISECLGAHVACAPFIGSAVIAPLALAHADATLRDDILGVLGDGQATAGVAFSELAGARGDAGLSWKDNKLSGRSLFVLDPQADYLFVANQEGQLFLVERDAAGLSAAVLTTVDRTRASGTLVFDGTPAIEISNDADTIARLMRCARVMLSADTLGAAQYMLDSAVAYAKERKQFNRVIGSFQSVKHMCAEMAAALEPCRAMLWYASHALEEVPEEAAMIACQTKAHLSEVGTFVARTATEVHGGVGFTDLLGLHYWFKRIGFNRQALGGPEILREEAARAQGL